MKKLIKLTVCCTILMFFHSGCGNKDYSDRFATLYGVISDHQTGEPIPVASVVLSPGGRTQTTGADGRYEFLDLEPRQYTVTVQKAGYETNRKAVMAIVGEKTEANIPLTAN